MPVAEPGSGIGPVSKGDGDMTTIFERRESRVRSYSRAYPAVFRSAAGARLTDTEGRTYIDFLAGAGSLNYGHNHPALRDALIDYVRRDGMAHSLDLHTEAKAAFLTAFEDRILASRHMDYVVQFTGPTGTNAVEAALKLARIKTGRTNVISFTNGFHGVSLGALAATGNGHHRGAAGLPLVGVTRMPYDGYLGYWADTTLFLEKLLSDPSGGIDKPAAVIVECVQGEGGLNAARADWLRSLQALCRRHAMLLIVDDIQAGCGRTGTFFSFEEAGIEPDIVTLSKSLSGYGLPMAVVLIRRGLDAWQPGAHNGTFRGNNHAFVTAAAALELFWSGSAFEAEIAARAVVVSDALAQLARRYPDVVSGVRGRGMMQGIALHSGAMAARVTELAYRGGLIVEAAGPRDEVVKCLAPLTIEPDVLADGLTILADAVAAVAKSCRRPKTEMREVPVTA